MVLKARKSEHIDLAIEEEVDNRFGPGWDELELVHEALPEVNFSEIDLSVPFLGWRLQVPLIIAAMTGGHPAATRINGLLAGAAERFGLAMGVGSQRAALQDPKLEETYSVVRDYAPTAPIIGNIGASQLIPQGDSPPLRVEQVKSLVDMIRADALAIHLNFLEELVQPEGDKNTKGCAEAIKAIVGELDVPVIIKETGAGISRRTAERLKQLGAGALDVGGAGGTSFAIIERLRAQQMNDQDSYRLGMTLGDWGIPTAAAVAAAADTGLPLIATGGIRTGLDAAKAIALGADAVGVARPILTAVNQGEEELHEWVKQFILELRAVLHLTGSGEVHQLKHQSVVAHGRMVGWFNAQKEGRV